MTLALTPSPYRAVIEHMFRVVDRRGVAVDFTLNDQQAELDALWTRRNLITKIRQHSGISTYVIARYVAKCLTEENRRCVIVSAESDATARLLARARYILNNLKLPEGVRPQLGTDNQRAIVFSKTGSSFWIGTAGSRVFGRGDTITDLHLSEAAFYENPQALADGLLPATELGEVTVESTGNGVGNWFHRNAVRAREGLGYKLFFFGWEGVASCSLPFPSPAERDHFVQSLRSDLEEDALAALGVSPEQLAWRRERIIEYDFDLARFKANFPRTFDECFQSTGYGFFNNIRYVQTDAWERQSAHLHALRDHPKPGLSYVIGADPSGGVGRDNAVAQVFCLETQEQVAEWASAFHEPPAFAVELAALGTRFNSAYINVERNNHGGTTLAKLIDIYPLPLIHRGSRGGDSPQEVLSRLAHFGTAVTPSSRGIILGTARHALATEYTIYSPALHSELSTFAEQDNGKIEANAGCFDDRVMAAAHALIVCEQAGVAATDQRDGRYEPDTTPDPFSWEGIFNKSMDGSAVYGIPARFH